MVACACGHEAEVSVEAVKRILKPQMFVTHIETCTRCTACTEKGRAAVTNLTKALGWEPGEGGTAPRN
jgi:hypothetical protein